MSIIPNRRSTDLVGRKITDDDAGSIASHVVDSLLDRLTDEEVVDKILMVWGRQLDQKIGRNVRRTLFWLMVVILIALAVRLDLFTVAVKKLFGV